MTDPVIELAAMGRALYGARWQSELARALDVGDRRVREWVSGDRPIPADVWPVLAALLAANARQCRELARAAVKLGRAR